MRTVDQLCHRRPQAPSDFAATATAIMCGPSVTVTDLKLIKVVPQLSDSHANHRRHPRQLMICENFGRLVTRGGGEVMPRCESLGSRSLVPDTEPRDSAAQCIGSYVFQVDRLCRARTIKVFFFSFKFLSACHWDAAVRVTVTLRHCGLIQLPSTLRLRCESALPDDISLPLPSPLPLVFPYYPGSCAE